MKEPKSTTNNNVHSCHIADAMVSIRTVCKCITRLTSAVVAPIGVDANGVLYIGAHLFSPIALVNI